MRVHPLAKCCLVVAAVVVMAAAGAVIVLRSINLETVKDALATQIRTATGRTLTIAGPVKLQWGLVPSLVATDIALSNPVGSTRPAMITLARLELEVALMPLLKREIVVNRLVLTAPDVLLETEAHGPGNFDFSPPTGAAAASQASEQPSTDSGATTPLRLFINELKVTNGQFTWHDRTTKTTESIAIPTLTLQPKPTAPELLNIQLATTFKDRGITVTGEVGSPFAPGRSKPWPVNLTLNAQGLLAQIQGSIADVATRQGLALTLTAQGPELMEMIHLAGMTIHGLPQQLGPFRLQGRLREVGTKMYLQDIALTAGSTQQLLFAAKGAISDLTGTVTVDLATEISSEQPAAATQLAGIAYTGKGIMHLAGQLQGGSRAWKISQLQVAVGDNTLSGDLTVQFGERTKLTGTLSSTSLNPADFSIVPVAPVATSTQDQGALIVTKSDGRVFPSDPLPFALLHLLDADLSLRAALVTIDKQEVRDLAFTAALDKGRLHVKPFHFGLAGGRIEGEIVVDATGQAPRVSLQLQGRQIEIGALNRNGPISGGKSDLKVTLTGSGNSVRALMASATGETSLSIGEGRLRNKALDRAAGDLLVQVLGTLNPFAKSEDSSQLVCAAARFVIRDGIATADNGVAMRTAQVDVMGTGTVNLRSEEIDLALKPRARGGTGLSLTTPLAGLVKVGGTIANPTVGIDKTGALKTAASVGAGFATGGLSTLGELLFDKVTADDDPCRTALGLPQQTKASQKTERSPKKSGGLLQGLFGK